MRHYKGAVLLLATLGSAGCASNTGFTSTWRDPTVKSVQFTKVLAVVISKEEGLRRSFETEMVKAIEAGGKAEGVPAYSLFKVEELRDTARAKPKAIAAGIDGIVTMRVVAVEKEQRYVEGSATMYGGGGYYGNPWGYYNYGWTTVYTPGYLVTDQYVQVETHIYSLPLNKLIWAGRSETVNPGSVDKLVDEVGTAVRDELHAEGLVGK
jgi:hypothetical protein